MKKKEFLIFIFSLLFSIQISSQENSFRSTYVFEGALTNGKETHKIKMNFLILLDSSIVGSYYYNAKNGSLDLAGKMDKNYSFMMSEWFGAKNTGTFKGKLSKNKEEIHGVWMSKKGNEYKFKLHQVKDDTYWSIIRKNRNLYEYKEQSSIIKNIEKVLSIDLANKSLSSLPNEFLKLKQIQSINLLGNNFTTFPKVILALKTLDEISLSTNKLKSIDPEIKNLQNLKILILNNNQLKELPKEIGELSNLKYLELGNNQLNVFPDEIKNLKNLEEMHIEDNNLSEKEKKKLKILLPNCVIYF